MQCLHPVLFEIGGFTATSYGVALVLAFAAGIAVAARRARARGLDSERIVDASILILLTSLLGSRLLWIATHRARVAEQGGVLAALLPWNESGSWGLVGLSMQGGVALAIATAFAYLRWRRVPLLPALDVMAPSVALGEGITRIGCFLNGCCHGLVCSWPWAVRFPRGSTAGELFGDVPVHPTQLYASATGFAIFALLSAALRRRPFDGAIVCAWLVLTGIQRIAVDGFRYYEPSVTLFALGRVTFTVNTAVAIAMFAAGVLGFARLAGRGRRANG
jgi:phosphatidylglycerol:prolipoprotein diacylglycerol transferase